VYWFAKLRFRGHEIQGIVGHLKREAQMMAKGTHPRPPGRGKIAQHGANRTAGGKQRSCFEGNNAIVISFANTQVM
jgi:hypothetical protein